MCLVHDTLDIYGKKIHIQFCWGDLIVFISPINQLSLVVAMLILPPFRRSMFVVTREQCIMGLKVYRFSYSVAPKRINKRDQLSL